MNLPKSEEQVMEILWKKEETFMKEIIEAYPEPKPKPSTVATLLKRLRNKGAISFKAYGNSRAYFTLISKEAYFSGQLKTMIKNFFNDSKMQFASFFTSETDLSDEELEEIRRMVDEKLKSRGK